ncbi:MAG: hypothetical protein ACRC5T_01010 [Cetobacterium sp.]
MKTRVINLKEEEILKVMLYNGVIATINGCTSDIRVLEPSVVCNDRVLSVEEEEAITDSILELDLEFEDSMELLAETQDKIIKYRNQIEEVATARERLVLKEIIKNARAYISVLKIEIIRIADKEFNPKSELRIHDVRAMLSMSGTKYEEARAKIRKEMC